MPHEHGFSSHYFWPSALPGCNGPINCFSFIKKVLFQNKTKHIVHWEGCPYVEKAILPSLYSGCYCGTPALRASREL